MEAIYALGNPIDGEVYYIGRTAVPSIRWVQHCSHSENYSDSLRHTLSRNILTINLKPVMVVLEWTEDGRQRELDWMQTMRKLGYILTNGGKKWIFC
jgi:hypothetical protein